jgi:hypothetical protein
VHRSLIRGYILFSLVCWRRGPLFTSPPKSLSLLPSGYERRWVKIRVKTPLECMVKNFKKGFTGDHVVNS